MNQTAARPTTSVTDDRWSKARARTFVGLTECEGEDVWKGPFLFAVLADTQLGALEDNETWDEEVSLIKTAVARLNQLKPKFAIVCGDLVNHVPAMYPDTDPEIRTRQVIDFKEAFSGLDPAIPLLCVCGNHDVGNVPSHVTVERYLSEFGDDYFAFWVGGVRGIVINSNLYFDPSQAKDLYERQQAWLKAEFTAARASGATHIILFAHHPLFLYNADEGDDPSEMGEVEFTTRKGEKVNIPNTYFHLPRERRHAILSLMKEHGCRHAFSGHWHQNHVVTDTSSGIQNVVTSAVGLQLGDDQPGFRLVKVYEDALEHRYFAMAEFPAIVPLSIEGRDSWG